MVLSYSNPRKLNKKGKMLSISFPFTWKQRKGGYNLLVVPLQLLNSSWRVTKSYLKNTFTANCLHVVSWLKWRTISYFDFTVSWSYLASLSLMPLQLKLPLTRLYPFFVTLYASFCSRINPNVIYSGTFVFLPHSFPPDIPPNPHMPFI